MSSKNTTIVLLVVILLAVGWTTGKLQRVLKVLAASNAK